MAKPVLIILAGGEETGDLYQKFGYRCKALLPLHGKPMLDWVVEAFHESQAVEKIIVVGPPSLDELHSMKFVEKRLPSTSSLLKNIVRGIAYANWEYYRGVIDHPGYVISFCDAVFLTDEIVKDTLRNIQSDNYDFVLHYIEKETYDKNNIVAKRTYIPIKGKFYTGSAIYFVKSFRKTLMSAHLLYELRARRKDPNGLLSVLGLKGVSIEGIELAISKRLNGRAAIFISDHAGLGMDVDKVADFEIAEIMLPAP